jgi:hypothetical protein
VIEHCPQKAPFLQKKQYRILDSAGSIIPAQLWRTMVPSATLSRVFIAIGEHVEDPAKLHHEFMLLSDANYESRYKDEQKMEALARIEAFKTQSEFEDNITMWYRRTYLDIDEIKAHWNLQKLCSFLQLYLERHLPKNPNAMQLVAIRAVRDPALFGEWYKYEYKNYGSISRQEWIDVIREYYPYQWVDLKTKSPSLDAYRYITVE